MKTLYDVLGALPSDDAEGLRTAFRKAVKGAHPDIRPGDPDAALKFRQITRANEILGDAEQRAAYDYLLEFARLEQQSAAEHAIAARIHKLASGVIALAGISVVTVGGYLLFMHMSAALVAPANKVDVTVRASAEIAPVSPAGSPDTTNESASPTKSESTSVPAEAIVPSAAMPQPNAESIPAANVGPAPDPAARDARSLRARGTFAYRNGDLNGAIADLDQALHLDPKFLAAYLDRGIVFYRLRKFDRAFADIARAKRIEKASRSRSAPTMARKLRFDQAAIAPPVTPVSQRRAAAQDPSREEAFASVRLR
jgi:tetratricopeptide (TPR) repeat protein